MVKVAIMSSWNACCGVSTHAELIGEALIRQGHEMTVFAPRQYEDDNTMLYYTHDQDYVIRNYSFLRYGDRCTDKTLLNSIYIDTDPILDADFDLLFIEKPTSTPLGRLIEILPRLKKKARIMAVLHEGLIPVNPYFSRFDWDAISVFDERYLSLFSSTFSEDKMRVVPFPCHPVELRSRSVERDKLGISRDAIVVLSFGRVHKLEDVLRTMRDLREDIPDLMYLYLTGDTGTLASLRPLQEVYGFLEVRFGRPPTSMLYDYLGACDAVLFSKPHPQHVAVSSSVHLCLGSLTPILCSDVSYFETFEKEVVKYGDEGDLDKGLRSIFDGRVDDVRSQARGFVEEFSADVIAKRLLEIGLGGET